MRKEMEVGVSFVDGCSACSQASRPLRRALSEPLRVSDDTRGSDARGGFPGKIVFPRWCSSKKGAVATHGRGMAAGDKSTRMGVARGTSLGSADAGDMSSTATTTVDGPFPWFTGAQFSTDGRHGFTGAPTYARGSVAASSTNLPLMYPHEQPGLQDSYELSSNLYPNC